MKTKAAVSYEPGQPLVVEELELDAPKKEEVLVRMAAVGLCRSDHNVLAGKRPVGMRPMVLGHEGAGVVEAVGPGVTRIQPGDHVVLMFLPACGECEYCLSGQSSACVLGPKIAQGPLLDGTFRLHNQAGQDVGQFCLLGAFSEYAVVHQDSVCVIDPRYPLESACLVGCGVTGGFNAAVTRAGVRPGSSVLVLGVGGLGINVIQGARAAHAGTIIAADLVEQKLSWARDFGATHTIQAGQEDVVEKTLQITGGAGVEYAFEAISSPETIRQAFDATAKLGKVVVLGLPQVPGDLSINPLSLVLTQKTLMGSLYGTSNARLEIPRLLRMYDNGLLKLDELVTRTYTLDQINQGYADMQAGVNIRGVVRFDW